MKLTLLVPGLLWPRDVLRNVSRDLSTPALSALLGRGAARRGGPLTTEDWLARQFGLEAERAPWAALRLLGEGGEPGADEWICADPAHLRFARETFVLAGAHELDLGRDEADALRAALAPAFEGVGELLAPAPDRWYVRMLAPAGVTTGTMNAARGRRADVHLPRGERAREWARRGNECQMLLHEHPVNQAREASGRLPVNSLWFWGAGALTGPFAGPFGQVWTNDPMAAGLARASGASAGPLPETCARDLLARGADALAVIDRLETPRLCAEVGAWREALARLERDWLAPLLASLYAGQLAGLRIVAPGDEGSLEVTVGAQDRWKFWRRPCTLDALAGADT